MFKWAVSEELVSETTYRALTAVRGLEQGRTEARETEPVQPVPAADVDAVLPHVLPPVAAMIRVQRLTGMRPGEACLMRVCDIDRSGDVWLYRPPQHKTRHKGKARVVALGPKAQEALCPFLRVCCPHCGSVGLPAALWWQGSRCGPCHDRADEGRMLLMPQPATEPSGDYFLFSPAEALAAKRAAMRAARKTKVQPSQQKRRKKCPRRAPGLRYSPESYARAVAKACRKAGVPHWHPHQLRHLHATEVRRRFGLEAAQVALGHSQANVTQVYAERDLTLATKEPRIDNLNNYCLGCFRGLTV
jgi:integrase